VRTLEQVRHVLSGTQVMEFQATGDEDRYAWIEAVLKRFDYRCLARGDRGPVLAYLQRLSGYSRAYITRLVSRWDAGKPLVKNFGAPRCPFARLYTPADVALLVDVDRAMGTLSGPATQCAGWRASLRRLRRSEALWRSTERLREGAGSPARTRTASVRTFNDHSSQARSEFHPLAFQGALPRRAYGPRVVIGA